MNLLRKLFGKRTKEPTPPGPPRPAEPTVTVVAGTEELGYRAAWPDPSGMDDDSVAYLAYRLGFAAFAATGHGPDEYRDVLQAVGFAARMYGTERDRHVAGFAAETFHHLLAKASARRAGDFLLDPAEMFNGKDDRP